MTDTPEKTPFHVLKTSEDGGGMPVTGTVYTVYSDKDCTKSVGTLTVGKDGKSNVFEVLYGTYYVKETKAAEGYALDTEVHTVECKSTSEAEIKLSDKVVRAGIRMTKWDAELGRSTAQGSGTLKGAQIEIISENDYDIVVNGKTVSRGGTAAKLVSDAEGVMQTSADLLPIGSYSWKEVKAPAGYSLGGAEGSVTEGTFAISAEDAGTVKDLTGKGPSDAVLRAGVRFDKQDLELKEKTSQGDAVLEGAVIDIVSENDNPVSVGGKEYKKGDVVLTLTTGNDGTAASGKDALPVGSYSWKETKAPAGYLLEGTVSGSFVLTDKDAGTIKDLSGKGPSDQVIRGGMKIGKWEAETDRRDPQGGSSLGGTTFAIVNKSEGPVLVGGKLYITVYRNGAVVDCGTVDDDEIPKVEMATQASNDKAKTPEGHHIALAEEKTELTDKVSYDGLTSGKTYTLKTVLMDRTTGTVVQDKNGKDISLETKFKVHFWNRSGTVEVPVVIDARGLEGHTVVFFEYLYDEDGKEIGRHTDIDDEDQTIVFPKAETEASDEVTKTNIILPAEDIRVKDILKYENLLVGKEYLLTGTLMDKKTGEAVLDDNGQPVTTTKRFTAEKKDGEVEMLFEFSGVKLARTVMVAFEKVSISGVEIMAHADINDEAQTVTIGKKPTPTPTVTPIPPTKVPGRPSTPSTPGTTTRSAPVRTGDTTNILLPVILLGVSAAVRELEKTGYLTRHQERLENGKIGRIEYSIFERPQIPAVDDGGAIQYGDGATDRDIARPEACEEMEGTEDEPDAGFDLVPEEQSAVNGAGAETPVESKHAESLNECRTPEDKPLTGKPSTENPTEININKSNTDGSNTKGIKDGGIKGGQQFRRYGTFGNVFLTDDEFDRLRHEFPSDYMRRIERLSEYMATTGKRYDNHLSTIERWSRWDSDKSLQSQLPVRSYSHERYRYREGESL